MQSKAATVEEYLAGLPEDRRAALEAVRKVFLKNLDPKITERMSYGMIGYAIPHSVYPAGYHCDPKMPLPYAGLASQKGHMSLYLMCVYFDADGNCGDAASMGKWFREAWAKTGKKLDMGKSCIRFKRVEDLALDVIAEAIRRAPADKFIAWYEAAKNAPREKAPRAAAKAAPGRAKAGSASTKAPAKPSRKAAPAPKPPARKPSSKRAR